MVRFWHFPPRFLTSFSYSRKKIYQRFDFKLIYLEQRAHSFTTIPLLKQHFSNMFLLSILPCSFQTTIYFFLKVWPLEVLFSLVHVLKLWVVFFFFFFFYRCALQRPCERRRWSKRWSWRRILLLVICCNCMRQFIVAFFYF